MFRIAAKSLSSRLSSLSSLTRLSPLASSSSSSLFRSSSSSAMPVDFDERLAVPDVIRYCRVALTKARVEKSVGSYGFGYLLLKYCLTDLTVGEDMQHENSKGLTLLAMSTLMTERGNPEDFENTIKQLDGIHELTHCYLGFKVAAFEGLAGLYLERGEDDKASEVADKCWELLEKEKSEDKDLIVRAKALKGLIKLANGDVQSAGAFFNRSLLQDDGSTALSYGQYLQAQENYPDAREAYRSVINGALEMQKSNFPYLGACYMNLDGIMIAAYCALGQIEHRLGNFYNSEQALEKALKMAEDTYGEQHPKVGAILTCTILMYRDRALDQKIRALLLEEAVYKRTMEILKVPEAESKAESESEAESKAESESEAESKAESESEAESEGAAHSVDRNIAALARAAYAEDYCIHENRKEEREEVQKLAESIWSNRRMSLADALDTKKNLCLVFDIRTSRLM